MRVDFYQLSRDPVERTIPLLASKVKAAGERLLIVSDDEAQLRTVSDALWADRPSEFLANGLAGEGHEARQPILLSHLCEALNGARMVMLADGLWRAEVLPENGGAFDRVMLMFDDARIEGARACWRELGAHPELERHFWRQEDGRWNKAG
ncbi:DNA polymerase III subunit chi [Croceicoccus estronivorus]|uniref:DNA polymerase III subunit chi n=1 Tax=Croceicoccus estronivorus TaxID=1172626 RepID=UPI00082BD7C1|nr:DNA polymerase III subunit chi [Croceicoccus estronivorus]OCC22543.1 DNA polymerase III subunit chi [Croceicoccus estronivorus]